LAKARPLASPEPVTAPISLGRIARGSTLIIAISGAWLYFTGWAFLYSYFNYFGINLIEIDPSVQYVFMHSVPPLRYYLTLWNVMYLLLIYISSVICLRYVFGFAVASRYTRLLLSPLGQFFLLLAIIVLAFYVSFTLGRTTGADAASYFWNNPPEIVYFGFKQSNLTSDDSPVNLVALNDEMKLKYLISTKEFHYAFYREYNCNSPHCGLIFRIPNETVNEIMIVHQ
jgi:hypothetical protein